MRRTLFNIFIGVINCGLYIKQLDCPKLKYSLFLFVLHIRRKSSHEQTRVKDFRNSVEILDHFEPFLNVAKTALQRKSQK